ncbi:MAG: hypothetical protein H0X51_03170 [Parachlamydiaceae bacterium]|nr:hypothetical protein [Parachlamydiaceae bacterium]
MSVESTSSATELLFNAAKKPVFVPKSDADKWQAIFNKHKGNIWAAYEEDSKLFTQITPLWACTAVPVNGDNHLTNEQAKIIFPLLAQDTNWDLGKFPKLTSECLEHLPKQVKWLVMPQKTNYGHFKYLTRLENLRYVFIYHAPTGSEGDLKYLSELPLERLQMPLLAQSIRIAAILPPTLVILQLAAGELSDNHLSEFLKEKATKLKNFYLSRVTGITAGPFVHATKLDLEQLFVDLCPDVDKTQFLACAGEKKGRSVRHMNTREIEMAKEAHARHAAQATKDATVKPESKSS